MKEKGRASGDRKDGEGGVRGWRKGTRWNALKRCGERFCGQDQRPPAVIMQFKGDQ